MHPQNTLSHQQHAITNKEKHLILDKILFFGESVDHDVADSARV